MTALGVANTIPAGNVRHRLGLGIEWFDALSQLPAPRGWTSELRAIGSRPLVQRFEQHPRGRHALRHAGVLVAWLERADEDKQAVPPATPADDPTNVVLYGYGQIHPDVDQYDTGNDPRVFVPRRLALTPVQAGGVPAATRDNIRQAWLWPGAAYPIPSKASAVRGCVRRGASLAAARPVPWARVVFTRPGSGAPNFSTESKLGHAHGDDRGEFLAVFGAGAVTGGAALPAQVNLHAWVFLPPAVPAFKPDDPLASLPLEVAGTDALNDLLRGTAVPPAYVRQSALPFTLTLGKVAVMDDTDLLFA
ncbi:MAG TPA: hypothetical protein VGD76_08290 [Ramlibacter sp.]